MILLWLQKEQMEFWQTRVIVQTMVDRSKGSEVFEEYKKIRFPWIESTNTKQRMDHIKKLMSEVKQGPLVVTPQAQPGKMKSQLRTRYLEKKPTAPISAKSLAEQRKLYDSMGKTIPR